MLVAGATTTTLIYTTTTLIYTTTTTTTTTHPTTTYRLFGERDHRMHHFVQVMGRDGRREPHGDPVGTVDEQLGHPGG